MKYRGIEFDVRQEGHNCYLMAIDYGDEGFCSIIDAGSCYLFEHVSCDQMYFDSCDVVDDLPLVADIVASYCDMYMIEEG